MLILLGYDEGLYFVEDGVMCIQCGRILSTIHSGRRHIKETHQPNEQAQCGICKKIYKNERQRNNHYYTAHGVSPKKNTILQELLDAPPKSHDF